MKLRHLALLFMVWFLLQLNAQIPGQSNLGHGTAHGTGSIVAVADKSIMNEDGSTFIEVLANDTGLGDGLIVVTITGIPAHGTAVVNVDNTITYSPLDNYNGSDTLTYQICNVNGQCSSSIATITINAVNDPPIINVSPITQTINEGEGSSIVDIPANITNTDGDVLSVSVVKNPAHGTVSLDDTGNLVYTPNKNFNGADTIMYRVCDNGTPLLCAKGLAIVIVHHINVSPILVSSLLEQPIQACSGQIQLFTRSDCHYKWGCLKSPWL